MSDDLFCGLEPAFDQIQAGAYLLRRCVAGLDLEMLAQVQSVFAVAPPRQMTTPGGFRMSVAMSNCGEYGWITDSGGYRYSPRDPDSGRPWPPMPAAWSELAGSAARRCGFDNFQPDACVINRYAPGARMSLHQDRNERDFSQPIVSVSLGLPVVFLFGGDRRADKTLRVPLSHGDAIVWGGPARLRFHGVLPLKAGQHAVLGAQRINLTFRKAL